MILIDLGNSRVKIAAIDKTEEFVTVDNAATVVDEVHGQIKALQSGTELVISSVRKPASNKALVDGLEKFGYKLRFIRWQDLQTLFKTEYNSRESLGIDRQLALLGARSLTNDTSVVIDLGTASTIDAIDQHQQHLGGVIFAGLDLQREALLSGTDDIQIDQLGNAPILFPLSTSDAVSSGTLRAWRASVLNLRQEMLEKLPKNTKTVITGGQHVLLDIDIDETISIVPDLVMRGMKYMLQQEQ